MSSKIISVLRKNDRINVPNLMKESGIKTKLKFINEILDIIEENASKQCNMSDYKTFVRMLGYLEKVISYQTSVNKQLIINRLQEIKNKFIVKTKSITNREKNEFKSSQQLISSIEAIIFIYQNTIKIPNNKQEVGYELLNYIVFEARNYYLFLKALENFPYMVNLLDENDKTILENVIHKYLKYINETPLIDNNIIVYYDSIMSAIYQDVKLKISDEIIEKNIEYVESYLKLNDQKKMYYIAVKDKVKQFLVNKVDNKKTIKLLRIHEDFPKIVADEVLTIKKERHHILSRMKVEDYVITIDDDSSRELDDGISIRRLENGNLLLGVHITNVLSVIPYHSSIIKEAGLRTTSIYCNNYHIPMLPAEISLNMLSLKEDKNRPCNSYYFEMDCDGNIYNSKFLKTMVTINKRYNYQNSSLLMKSGSDDKKLDEMFENYVEVLNALNKRYNRDEIYMMKKQSSSNLSNTNIMGNTIADKLVELVMLVANNEIFKFFASNNIPCLYRSHKVDKSVKEEIKKLIAMKTDAKRIIKVLNTFYPKAFYSSKNYGHYGMNLDAYGHATSPLRRFPDIITERCLDVFYYSIPTNEEAYKLEEEIKIQEKYINEKQLSIEQYINTRNKE